MQCQKVSSWMLLIKMVRNPKRNPRKKEIILCRHIRKASRLDWLIDWLATLNTVKSQVVEAKLNFIIFCGDKKHFEWIGHYFFWNYLGAAPKMNVHTGDSTYQVQIREYFIELHAVPAVTLQIGLFRVTAVAVPAEIRVAGAAGYAEVFQAQHSLVIGADGPTGRRGHAQFGVGLVESLVSTCAWERTGGKNTILVYTIVQRMNGLVNAKKDEITPRRIMLQWRPTREPHSSRVSPLITSARKGAAHVIHAHNAAHVPRTRAGIKGREKGRIVLIMSPRLSPLDSTWRKRRPGNSSFPQ